MLAALPSPIRLPELREIVTPGPALPIGLRPLPESPIKLPTMSVFSDPVSRMPSPPLPEMTFPSPAESPPMTLPLGTPGAAVSPT